MSVPFLNIPKLYQSKRFSISGGSAGQVQELGAFEREKSVNSSSITSSSTQQNYEKSILASGVRNSSVSQSAGLRGLLKADERSGSLGDSLLDASIAEIHERNSNSSSTYKAAETSTYERESAVVDSSAARTGSVGAISFHF
uniref:Uncharacterized protein n=1 Tax=Bracon brevicornis TaxID=1563983 RepID=A0A6V7LZM3_9HYME